MKWSTTWTSWDYFTFGPYLASQPCTTLPTVFPQKNCTTGPQSFGQQMRLRTARLWNRRCYIHSVTIEIRKSTSTILGIWFAQMQSSNLFWRVLHMYSRKQMHDLAHPRKYVSPDGNDNNQDDNGWGTLTRVTTFLHSVGSPSVSLVGEAVGKRVGDGVAPIIASISSLDWAYRSIVAL